MSISAKEAADQTGMTKAGIIKAIKSGKISAIKNVHGEWCIEPVELFRVYPPATMNGHRVDTNVYSQVNGSTHPNSTVDTASIQALEVEISLLRVRLADKDHVIADKDDVIADLRQRLDSEAEERRRLSHMLNAALPQPQPAPAKPLSWWARLFTL